MDWKPWGLIGFLLLLILAVRFYFFYQTKPEFKSGQEITLRTTLLSEPQLAGKIQRFYVDKILVIAPRFPEYHYGDSLIISGTLEQRLLTNRQGNQQILTLYFPKIGKRNPALSGAGLALASIIRQKVTSTFKSILPNTESGLLLGIVLGLKENLPQELMASLKTSGTLHVVAASGMNVTMVGGFLTAAFGVFLRRQIALILVILGIFFYALLAGLEPSIVRAGVMGAITYCALILGRQNLAILSLLITGYLMLIIAPGILTDVGFQLSFLATLGLVTLKPQLDRLVLIKKVKNYQLGNDLTTTLAAQLATLPILLSNFGNYSPLSIMANTAVLWTIAPLMVLGGLASISSLIFEPVSQILLILTLPLLLFFEKVVLFFATLGGQLRIESFPIAFSLGYYFILVSLVLFLFYRPKNA